MKHLKRLLLGASLGSAVALAFLLIGLIRVGFRLVRGGHVVFDGFFPMIAWYVFGFAVAGSAVGLFYPLTRLRPLRYVLGILAAACFMGAIVIGDAGAPATWSHNTFVGWAGLSVAFGLACGLGMDRGMTTPKGAELGIGVSKRSLQQTELRDRLHAALTVRGFTLERETDSPESFGSWYRDYVRNRQRIRLIWDAKDSWFALKDARADQTIATRRPTELAGTGVDEFLNYVESSENFSARSANSAPRAV